MQQNEDSISSLWDNFKRSNIRIIGMPEEELEQEIGNLYEKIVKENFPNLVKEIEISNLSHAEFKTLVIRMLEEIREDLNNKKKIQK